MRRFTTAFAMLAAGTLGVSALADVTVIEDFASAGGDPDFGIFTFGAPPGGSGSNKGASAGSTTVSAAQWAFTPVGQSAYVNELSVTDDNFIAPNGSLFFGQPSAWNFRHVANGGSPGTTNLVTSSGATGWVGFYLKTTAENLVAAIALDEAVGGSGGTEVSTRVNVINDGNWHLYQWNLADDTQWDAFFGASNGNMDGTGYTIDSINFWDSGAEDGETSAFELAYVGYSSDGPLPNLIPEPSALLLIGAGALGLVTRRGRA